MIDFNKPAELTFITDDHPEACGRAPQRGEAVYQIYFTLEYGRILCIECGQSGFDNLSALVQNIRDVAHDIRVIDEAGK